MNRMRSRFEQNHTSHTAHRSIQPSRNRECKKGISMKHMAFSLTFTVLLAALVFAQQGQPPPSTSPPYQTPPTFPEGRTAPRQQLPPDTEAPAPTSQEVERQITRGLSS